MQEQIANGQSSVTKLERHMHAADFTIVSDPNKVFWGQELAFTEITIIPETCSYYSNGKR